MKYSSSARFVGAMALPWLASLGIANAQLLDGLLNYWDFEGNFADSAGTYPGTASTATDNGSNPGGNVAFAGGGPLGTYGDFNRGYVEVPNSADVIAAGESLSISAWFRVDGFDQQWQALVAHGEGSDYRPQWRPHGGQCREQRRAHLHPGSDLRVRGR